MADAAFEALKLACDRQVAWLLGYATAYEQGTCMHVNTEGGGSEDLSIKAAEEFRHQANHIRAVISAYERLRSKSA